MIETEKHINTPLVSMVVPSYNHAAYIEECILSIVNQTYKNIELIVIDDGSTDNSRAILERLQKQYGFILEFQENQGVAKTMNRAIGIARGKYISGSASDDFLALDKIEKQVKFLEENPDCDLLFGKIYMVDKNSQLIEGLTIFESFPEPVKYITFNDLIESNCIPAASIMMRRAAWEKCGGYDENVIIEDFDLWLKIAYRGKVAYLNDYFAYYRWHGENASTYAFKIYTATWELVQSWKGRMAPDVSRKVLARRDSITFCILARKYKKESLKYLKLNHSYWDLFMLKNYMKGLLKLLFCRRNDHTIWK
ncbi:MAG: glycosyltransferase [Candidatus Symbiothrix sp.]|jgi:glycosyltransferase involved in cell wall biosynthesis|nr:glycosyltransferase [Candidatus Symbiothrix sp.]